MSSGDLTRLSIVGNTILDGVGVVTLGDSQLNQFAGLTGSILTNAAGHTIRGSGNLGAGGIGLDNAGLIEAVGAAGLTVSLNGAPGITRHNTGMLRATTGSTLTINSATLTNEGVIEAEAGGKVVITGAGTRIEGGTLNGPGDFTLAAGARLANLTNKSTVTIRDNDIGEIFFGTIVNDGTIALRSSGNLTQLSVVGNTTLGGTGVVTLSDSALNQITGAFGSNLTNAAGHTIRGSGNLGAGQIGLDNAGLVEAVGAAGLTVSLNGEDFVTRRNAGTMRATDGSTLTINRTGLTPNLINEGVIEAAAGGAVVITGGTLIFGGTLTGSGDFTLAESAGLQDLTNESTVTIGNNNDVRLFGTIVNDGAIALASSGNLTRLLIGGDVTLGGAGVVTLGDSKQNQITGTTGAILTNAAGHTIRGAGEIGAGLIGIANAGVIEADQPTALNITQRASLGPSVNTGVMRGSGGGGLSLAGGAFDNRGLVEAVNGSSVTMLSGTTSVNNSGGTLTGGRWRAAGAGSQVAIRGGEVATNAAEIILSGAGSSVGAFQSASLIPIEESLATNAGTLRILDDRDFVAENGLTNSGVIELGGGAFDAPSLTNTASGEIFGFGVIKPTVLNSGVVRAAGGALSVANGIVAASGTIIAEAGATLVVGADSGAEVLDLQGGALALGANDITVSGDYANSAFGVGDAFNRRANVTGAGQIIGAGAALGVGGDVVAGVLDFGSVRGGETATLSFTVDNAGAGAALRGAIQTGAGAGSITDARLSGAGVTAQNFGPVAAGDSAGSFAVAFDATTGGALTGQSIGVVQNFDNVADQTIQLQGFATSLAEGAAAPAGPVDLGAFRVGIDGPAQSFAVTNLTTGPGAERLGVASVGATGAFVGSNDLGAGLIGAGATATDAARVAVSGGVAGVNLGELAIQYATDGTAFDPSFTTRDANAQTIAVAATGFNLGAADVTPDPVIIANQRVGGGASAALTVANIGPDDGFTEALNAAVGGVSGAAVTNGGSVSLLAAGAADSASIRVGVDTATAGSKAGVVTLALQSDGAGTSGLAALALADRTVQVQGDVFALAEGSLNSAPLNFGTVQVGQVVGRALSITNSATGPAGFVEDLNASFGAASGTGASRIGGAGAIVGLAAGATDIGSMTVTVDTTASGLISGAIAINYFSAGAVGGVSNGLGALAIGSEDFAVSGLIEAMGAVIDAAQPVINTPQPIDLGSRRVGDVAPGTAVSVTNMATGGAQAALNATISGVGPVSATGSFSLLGPGATDATSLTVGLSTATAGTVDGIATIAFVSDASNVGGCAPNCRMLLPNQTLQVTSKVYQAAEASVETPVIDFGIVHVGDVVASQSVRVWNAAPSTALNDTLAASFSGLPASAFSGAGAVSGLGAGESSDALRISIDTSAAGVFDASGGFLAFASQNPDMADLDLPSGNLTLRGQVNNFANPVFGSLIGDGVLTGGGDRFVLDFGSILLGDTVSASFSVLNDVFGPSDILGGSFDIGGGGPFTLSGFDDFTGLGSGDAFSGLNAVLNAQATGSLTQFLLLDAIGLNASGFRQTFAPIELVLVAEVRDGVAPIPLPAPVWMLIGALAFLGALNRARSGRSA